MGTPSNGNGDGSDAMAHVGTPEFEHNQWTFEGEIERLGAFSTRAHRQRGWRRAVAILVAVALVLPVVVGMVATLARLFG